MGQVIDFHPVRELRPALNREARCRCSLCGADLWHISQTGEVCCADCNTVCPRRLQGAIQAGDDRRQADCPLGFGKSDID